MISHWILLKIGNFSHKSCRENQNITLCSITTPPPKKPCSLWDNVEKYGTARQATDDNIIRRMRFARWITKATDTHSEYAVILTVFPRQEWLCERATTLRLYAHSTLPVLYLFPGSNTGETRWLVCVWSVPAWRELGSYCSTLRWRLVSDIRTRGYFFLF